jgi:hypothetical protein
MRTAKSMFIAAAAASISIAPVAAKEPCPPVPSPLPWVIDQMMDGDRYADVYIDIDQHGKPTGCKMGQNNISGDDKFWVCQAFMGQWSTQPPADAGKTHPTTIMRKYVEYGMRHTDAESAARSKYFRGHPYERPECYPKQD